MPARETVLLFVHGANQSRFSRDDVRKHWADAFRVERTARKRLVPLVSGERNDEIDAYHRARHPDAEWPHYVDWEAVWYGDVWRTASANGAAPPVAERHNHLREEEAEEIGDILERAQRKVMGTHFDELVPFYELARLEGQETTIYEQVCSRLLDDLERGTGGERDYVLVGHSMGCAVSYNVLSHLSAPAGEPLCAIEGALSQQYEDRLRAFQAKGLACFGLMTFGNYTGYDWCQRLNNRILHGEASRHFRYPEACGRWRNFWTAGGGDPFILDDMIGDSMVGAEEDRFDDLLVLRPPFANVGHGLQPWFRRDHFAHGLSNQLERHLYRPGDA